MHAFAWRSKLWPSNNSPDAGTKFAEGSDETSSMKNNPSVIDSTSKANLWGQGTIFHDTFNDSMINIIGAACSTQESRDVEVKNNSEECSTARVLEDRDVCLNEGPTSIDFINDFSSGKVCEDGTSPIDFVDAIWSSAPWKDVRQEANETGDTSQVQCEITPKHEVDHTEGPTVMDFIEDISTGRAWEDGTSPIDFVEAIWSGEVWKDIRLETTEPGGIRLAASEIEPSGSSERVPACAIPRQCHGFIHHSYIRDLISHFMQGEQATEVQGPEQQDHGALESVEPPMPSSTPSSRGHDKHMDSSRLRDGCLDPKWSSPIKRVPGRPKQRTVAKKIGYKKDIGALSRRVVLDISPPQCKNMKNFGNIVTPTQPTMQMECPAESSIQESLEEAVPSEVTFLRLYKGKWSDLSHKWSPCVGTTADKSTTTQSPRASSQYSLKDSRDEHDERKFGRKGTTATAHGSASDDQTNFLAVTPSQDVNAPAKSKHGRLKRGSVTRRIADQRKASIRSSKKKKN